MRLPIWIVSVALVALVFGASAQARADASAWFFIGGGTAVWSQADAKAANQGMLNIDVGIGTTPDAPIIVGGLFRVQPLVLSGADLALLVRGATRGFQTGRFGIAIDAGAYERWWGDTSVGFIGDVTFGAPFGLQIALGGSYGTDSAKAFTAVAGIDLLRLTVYRQSALSLWPNPSPAEHLQSRGLFSRFFW